MSNPSGATSFGNPTVPAPVPLRHSVAGIISFCLALFSGLIQLIAIVMLIIFASGRMHNDEAGLVGSISCGGGLFVGVGLILAIVGLMQKGRKKIFAVLGLIGNGLLMFLALGGCVILLLALSGEM